MPFEPQNTLEESLVRATGDPDHRSQFYHDFVESEIFLIQDGAVEEDFEGLRQVEEGAEITLQPIAWHGAPHVPIFSSLPRMQAVLQDKARYIVMKVPDLLDLLQGADLVLNPGSQYGKVFNSAEIAAIIDGTIWDDPEPYTAEEEAEVMIGQPAQYPRELVDALVTMFNGMKDVRTAYLAHTFDPQRDEKPHTLIGIEVIGDWEEVATHARALAQEITIPDPPAEFMRLTGSGHIDAYFASSCEPFYTQPLPEIP